MVSAEVEFEKVGFIGLGLIGGSMAKALKQQGIQTLAYDQTEASLDLGLELGVIDTAMTSVAELCRHCDIVVLAVPVLAMPKLLPELSSVIDCEVTLTDVGSVKGSIVEDLTTCFGHMPNNFVPGHPIAGSEKHGVTASNPELFKKHKVLLTPNEKTSATHLQRVRAMWQMLGADVTDMSVGHHDLVLAQTSHLPHLLAFAVIDTLSQQGDSLEIFDYAAGGLRDFSRIAASDPTMWRDIFESNRVPLLEVLQRFQDDLSELQQSIADNQLEEVFTVLSRAKAARDHFSKVLEERKS